MVVSEYDREELRRLVVATAFRLKDGCERVVRAEAVRVVRRNRLSAEGWL